MLSKSKSKQIHLVKYLLVFPMVIGMLFYTSCSNDEKINKSVEENSSVSEEELFQKYFREIKTIEKEVGSLMSYDTEALGKYSEYETIEENYIQTKDLYIRSKAFMHALFLHLNEKHPKSKDDRVNYFEGKRNKTYETYLDEKKTQESIKKWENAASNYQLRKYVKDLDNITSEEQTLINSQAEQIRNDDYLHTQIISDGLRHKKIVHKIKGHKEIKEGREVSFAVIDQVPIYPGCDTSANNDDQRQCFSNNINKLVGQNFNLNLGKTLGLKGKQRIYTRFTIDKEGNIVNVKSRAPHPALEKEAIRVVKLIPRVQPGFQDRQLVNVTFDLPITFNIQE